MKFTAIFKTPDAIEYGIIKELSYLHKDKNESDEEYRDKQNELRYMLQDCAEKFVAYGEMIVVEFDTETMTAIVVPKSR